MLRLLLYVRVLRLLPAYIDPGAGSMLIQAIIAGAVALPVLFRDRIGRAVRALRGQGDRNDETERTRDEPSTTR